MDDNQTAYEPVDLDHLYFASPWSNARVRATAIAVCVLLVTALTALLVRPEDSERVATAMGQAPDAPSPTDADPGATWTLHVTTTTASDTTITTNGGYLPAPPTTAAPVTTTKRPTTASPTIAAPTSSEAPPTTTGNSIPPGAGFTMSRDSGPRGDHFELKGTGCEVVGIGIFNAEGRKVIDDTGAGPNGTWMGSIAVPSWEPMGRYQVRVICQERPSGGVLFEYEPQTYTATS